MRNPLHFFIELWRQPLWVPIWVTFLMGLNFAGVAFWPDPSAKLIVVTFVVSAGLMMALYSAFGFVKLLGLGHILWIPLGWHLLSRLPQTSGTLNLYLVTWGIATLVSLVLDVVDVWKYFTSKR